MNDHFIRIIFNSPQSNDVITQFAEQVCEVLETNLLESDNQIQFTKFETTQGHFAIEAPLLSHLDDTTAENIVDKLAESLDLDFEIEVSGDGSND